MKFRIARQRTTGGRPSAFTLIEVMVAVAIIGVEFGTWYLGMTQGFAIIQCGKRAVRQDRHAQTLNYFPFNPR